MNKNGKLKVPAQTFYICDRKRDCHGSGLCGTQCKHTTDIRHAKYKVGGDIKRSFHIDSYGNKLEKDLGRYKWNDETDKVDTEDTNKEA